MTVNRQGTSWHDGPCRAKAPRAFKTIRQRVVKRGASDGEVNDFGSVRSLFLRDPAGGRGARREIAVTIDLLRGRSERMTVGSVDSRVTRLEAILRRR